MIKEILRSMIDGDQTISEIALKLKISQDELINRLETLEHMGYLKRVSDNIQNNKKSCLGCSMVDICSDKNRSNSTRVEYQLTAKGKNVICK